MQQLKRVFLRAPGRSITAVLLSLLVIHMLVIGIGAIREFEDRRWDIPAGVYAAPLELYAGLRLDAPGLAAALDRLGFQQVEVVARPGQYGVEPGRVTLWTRPFRFWDSLDPAERYTVDFGDGRVRALENADGRRIALLRLEPMRLGSIFATHHEDRLLVEPDAIPPLLVDALKAVEDRKFDHHFGLDLSAILRAAWVNLRSGEIRQGGSTLTQQLVKSYFLDSRRTFRRKYREAVMAMALELRYDKETLLHAYVNEIYLGQQGARAIHGFGLASEFYFGKYLSQLELHETALLVALVKGPSYYDPRRHPERALERRTLVLRTLAELGIVERQTAGEAINRELGVTARSRVGSRYQPAYMDLVRRQLATEYSEESIATSGLRVFTSLDPRVQRLAEQQLVEGLESLQPEDEEAAVLEGAVVVTQPATGAVLAMVGGREVATDGFNRALDARRPVGSLIKPFVYLAALQSGEYTLASTVQDAPIDVVMENGRTWSPENFSRESHGEVSLLQALAASYNQATVRLGIATGVDAVVETLAAFGIEERPPAYPSLLLGSVDLAPFEVAALYSTLANDGFRTPLTAVRSVVDTKGQPVTRTALEVEQAADPNAVHQLNRGLVEVMQRGTGRSSKASLPEDLVVAGKTGTSDEYRDSWFAGFSGDHLAVVWVGRDDNEPTGLTGASGALSVWAPLMAAMPSTASYEPAYSADLQPVWIDYDTGLKSRRRCGDAVQILVPEGTRLRRQPGCSNVLGEIGDRMRDVFESLGN
ncbi:penicillin-binding protein 1B [Lentisalinibacter salinarum]|uniref:penicillin-binding protein 1B n=1 Tax=Lentisalinibacter salinarum TaxID=2992239 RepID=UPI0038681124